MQPERLVYGFDPLCGWCFAFRPTMQAIRAAYPDVPITLMMGGLVVGSRVGPVSESREYLINGLEQVRRTAGVSAGAAFYEKLLADGTYISDSEPPCRAVYVAQQIAPDQAFDFADALPAAYYVDGQPLDSEDVLGALAAKHGIDAVTLLEHWRSDEARRGVQQAFMQARNAGFTSYPTLAYQRGDKLAMVAQGFAAPQQAVQRIAELRKATV